MPPPDKGNHLRILQVHNEYYKGVGGEDTVVALELDMLRKHGHDVEQLIVSTSVLQNASPVKLAAAGLSTPWSSAGYRLVQDAITKFRPDLIHAHNTFPLLSPSIYWASRAMDTPVVQTLHNYRLVCANGLISRDDMPCEKCIGHLPLAALRYRCYKDSFLATAPLAAMQVTHRLLGTFERKVDAYISLTRFAKQKMVEAGLPAAKIFVKPNFIPPPPHKDRSAPSRRRCVFIGKVIRYKGLDLLLEAWSRIDPGGRQLIIIGEGPEKSELQKQYPASDRIAWLGWRDREEALAILAESDFQIIPSRVVEGLPMVLIEALALGTPTIAPDHGAFPELVNEGRDGYLFEPRDVSSLTEALRRAISLDDSGWKQMSARCVKNYSENYTEEANYRMLMGIYNQAVHSALS